MKVKIKKSEPFGEITAPPSKSMAHRLLIAAALSQGKSRISNIEMSQDVTATLKCLQDIIWQITEDDGSYVISGKSSFPEEVTVDCNESGSTLRFLLPIFSALNIKANYVCHGRLAERPLGIYEDLFLKQGISFRKNGNIFSFGAGLHAGEFHIEGNISSQFITGLLFALPLMKSDSKIIIEGELESRPYVDMTLWVLEKFGISVKENENGVFQIRGSQKYSAQNITCEGDWSNSAFFFALGDKVKVKGLDRNSLQGDKEVLSYFEKLSKEKAKIDISQCPDLGPVLFAYSALHNGGFFTGTKRLKIKESDRISAMKEECLKFGIEISEEENTVTVKKSNIHAPKETLYSHSDHRIAMALSVLAVKFGSEIQNSECVGKSMPDFFEKLRKLNVEVEEYET